MWDSHNSYVSHQLIPNKIYTSADDNVTFNENTAFMKLTNFTSKKYIAYSISVSNLSINVSNRDSNFNDVFGGLQFYYSTYTIDGNPVANFTDSSSSKMINLFSY